MQRSDKNPLTAPAFRHRGWYMLRIPSSQAKHAQRTSRERGASERRRKLPWRLAISRNLMSAQNGLFRDGIDLANLCSEQLNDFS
jgi:hypothetical protein